MRRKKNPNYTITLETDKSLKFIHLYNYYEFQQKPLLIIQNSSRKSNRVNNIRYQDENNSSSPKILLHHIQTSNKASK